MSINVLIITLTHYFALINRTKLMHEIDRTTGYIKELEKKSTLNVIKKKLAELSLQKPCWKK